METTDQRKSDRRRGIPAEVGHSTRQDGHEKQVEPERRRSGERRSLRVRRSFPVKFTTDHPALKDKFFSGTSREIGSEGVFLDLAHHETELTHLLDHKNYKIDLEIHFPEGGIAIKVTTEIVRVAPLSGPLSGKRFGMGLKFVEVSPDKKAELETYLNRVAEFDPEIIHLQERTVSQKEQFTFTKTLYLSDTNALGNA
jgi:hypothetical protein